MPDGNNGSGCNNAYEIFKEPRKLKGLPKIVRIKDKVVHVATQQVERQTDGEYHRRNDTEVGSIHIPSVFKYCSSHSLDRVN